MARLIKAQVTDEQIKNAVMKYYFNTVTDADIENTRQAIKEFEDAISDINAQLNEAYAKLYNNKDLFKVLNSDYIYDSESGEVLRKLRKNLDVKILNDFTMEDLSANLFSKAFNSDIEEINKKIEQNTKEIEQVYDDNEKELLINDPDKFFRG